MIYRRDIDFKMLILLLSSMLLLIAAYQCVPRDFLITLFYYAILPLVFIVSLLVFISKRY